MLVNISQACKLAGISRTVFYENYIKKGKVSTTRDARNRPMVDTTEILRVFGELQKVTDLTDKIEQIVAQADTKTEHPEQYHTQPNHTAQIAQLQAEVTQLKERLNEARERENEAKDREQWQRGQIEKLTDTIKLLEAPKSTQLPYPSPRLWWQFWK